MRIVLHTFATTIFVVVGGGAVEAVLFTFTLPLVGIGIGNDDNNDKDDLFHVIIVAATAVVLFLLWLLWRSHSIGLLVGRLTVAMKEKS